MYYKSVHKIKQIAIQYVELKAKAMKMFKNIFQTSVAFRHWRRNTFDYNFNKFWELIFRFFSWPIKGPVSLYIVDKHWCE